MRLGRRSNPSVAATAAAVTASASLWRSDSRQASWWPPFCWELWDGSDFLVVCGVDPLWRRQSCSLSRMWLAYLQPRAAPPQDLHDKPEHTARRGLVPEGMGRRREGAEKQLSSVLPGAFTKRRTDHLTARKGAAKQLGDT